MKRFQILVVALFAVFAFGVVVASSAMAEEEIPTFLCVPKAEGLWGLQLSATECGEQLTMANSPFELVTFLLAEWLVGGVAVTTTLLVTSPGELLMEDEKGPLGAKGTVLCSGILDGTIGPNGEDEITELLTLAGAAVGLTGLSGTALLCNGQEGCLTGTENAEVWAVNLPWLTLMELVEEASPTAYTGFADLILPHTGGGQPGWYTFCSTLLGNQEDQCTIPEEAAEKVNLTGGVTDIFSEAFTLLVGASLGKCSASSEEHTGLVTGEGETTTEGGVLSVSSVG